MAHRQTGQWALRRRTAGSQTGKPSTTAQHPSQACSQAKPRPPHLAAAAAAAVAAEVVLRQRAAHALWGSAGRDHHAKALLRMNGRPSCWLAGREQQRAAAHALAAGGGAGGGAAPAAAALQVAASDIRPVTSSHTLSPRSIQPDLMSHLLHVGHHGLVLASVVSRFSVAALAASGAACWERVGARAAWSFRGASGASRKCEWAPQQKWLVCRGRHTTRGGQFGGRNKQAGRQAPAVRHNKATTYNSHSASPAGCGWYMPYGPDGMGALYAPAAAGCDAGICRQAGAR